MNVACFLPEVPIQEGTVEELPEEMCGIPAKRVGDAPRPFDTMIRFGSNSIIVESGDRERIEEFFMPTTLVARDANDVRIMGMHGPVGSLHFEFASQSDADVASNRLFAMVLRVAGSLHTTIVASDHEQWYPTFTPVPGTQRDSPRGPFICAGYVIVSMQAMTATTRGVSHFRFVWAELRGPGPEGRASLSYYPSHEEAGLQRLLDYDELEKDMTVMGIALKIDSQTSSVEEESLPTLSDVDVVFRTPAEARFWHEMAIIPMEGYCLTQEGRQKAESELLTIRQDIQRRGAQVGYPGAPLLRQDNFLDRRVRIPTPNDPLATMSRRIFEEQARMQAELLGQVEMRKRTLAQRPPDDPNNSNRYIHRRQKFHH